MEGARRSVGWPLVWLGVAVGLTAGSLRTYSVQSTLMLSELAGAARDVGYRLSSRLEVQPLPAPVPDLLVAFRVRGLQLEVRGAHVRAEWQPRGAPWGQEGGQGGQEGGWRARWSGGELADLWLPAAASRDEHNYMRALTSLFQFQVSEGRRNETDISGECEVTYETLSSTVFRKTKRRCGFERAAGEEGVSARRVSRYTLSESRDTVQALHAEEVLWLPAHRLGEGEGEERAGVKARSWHALRLLHSEPAVERGAPPAHLQPAPLPLPLDDDDDEEDDEDEPESLASAVSGGGAALGGAAPGEGGSREAARALPPLLRALAAASAADLRHLLAREDLQDLLPGLCRALGLTGSAAAWSAARGLLAPAATDALESLALDYLAGLALAPRVHPAVAEEVLALGEEARLSSVAAAALLAGAAASAAAGPGRALAARDRLARALARAVEPETRATLLTALGNLRLAETTPLLLAAAERGPAAEAEAALGALRGARLAPAQAERALALAGNGSLALGVRALALELGAEAGCAATSRAVPLGLVRLARALRSERGAGAGELHRTLLQRLATLEEGGCEPARALRRLLPADLTTWDARAPPGTSSVLRREVGGWGAPGGARAHLLSAQLAAGGLLRRGRVALQAAGTDVLAVELWTSGLDAVTGTAGSGESPGEEEETAGAGLRVRAGGVALRPLDLFRGQAELLGHVWAGTGAAPTPVLRALLPAPAWRGRAPLQAGATLALRREGALSLALDAQGAVSLWQRTARARLALRAGAHAECTARVRAGSAVVRARSSLGGAARLRIAADVDFYDSVSVCVRTSVSPHTVERSASLRSACGPRHHVVRRVRSALWSVAGRELALGRANDAACRASAVADAEGDL